ncbi:hydroxyisourate hydrolase [Bacillus sp. 165]|uniref:hydroxyisourate hydrolase n=1 Tax=Bacillus sp. 165 TaxID=1529117 RepID=UPI001AD9604F|nr:hydroxyisourate hydrolase [Bacillus sp. 165]MBO9129262.1 hydroxyisourate hydrolase [Bacillus sp. 165]
MGGLTTHVLDVSQGRPASGVKFELWYLESGDTRTLMRTMYTNCDGRVDSPILSGEQMQMGIYELVFFVADYFRTQKVVLPDPPFLDVVPLRFGIADCDAHYHVPLLIAPGGYNTYRGS